MFTKYTTGQTVLIPAVIRSAREDNGKIIYEIDADTWRGVPEEQIIVDDAVSANAVFDRAMRQMARDIY